MSKPVLLTVDDDPEVLNAIERDLRHHFRADYRVVKASSGPLALETVQELKRRDAQIALFLVDERMPHMSGTQFLVEAIKIYPDARRVLLTAYADTETAIAAINEVGLDHYLLKPWEPPSVRLYPVLEDLLSEWFARARPAFDGIRVAGHALSPSSFDVKDFLASNQIPYQWLDMEDETTVRDLLSGAAGGAARLPLVFFPDGTALVQPTTSRAGREGRVADAGTEAVLRSDRDWRRPGGSRERSVRRVRGAAYDPRRAKRAGRPGGDELEHRELPRVSEWRHGRRSRATRRDAGQAFRRRDPHGAGSGGARDARIRIAAWCLSDGSELNGYAILISPGMEVRRLEAEGVEPLLGAGVYYGAALTEAATYRGRDVIVVGGANSAGQGAMFFSRHARRVTMLVRGPDISAGMSSYLVDRIAEDA